jgi:hypothetical protein
MYLALKKGTKKFHNTSKFLVISIEEFLLIKFFIEEFLVISIFHETKIPTVDIKVQIYSKFRKNKM